uniref:BPTI/Kunitz inhibitor domain-containing protein n=1 Tax=Arion vulgaris TaxID=1028688 RepID=A0A0B7ALC0_9EUPU
MLEVNMSTNLCKLLLVALATSFISLASGISPYQDLICRRTIQYNVPCNLTCTDGLARPAGCEICECRESMCTRSDAPITCDKGWHCEVQQTGKNWFRIDVTVCVADEGDNNKHTEETDKTTTTSSITTSIRATSTTITITSAAVNSKPTETPRTSTNTTVTPRQSATSPTTWNRTETEPTTCEQKGRCDGSSNCLDLEYECRSDGKCCKRESSRAETSTDIPRCQQRPDFGYCRSPVNKHIFNINTSRCIPIFYGGCGYSKNMFDSKEECIEICEKPCKMPLSDGPCRANIPRYFYDITQRKCIIFDYGGCQGNENNFRTAEACEVQCRMMYQENSISSKFGSVPKTHIIFPTRNENSGIGTEGVSSENYNSTEGVSNNNSNSKGGVSTDSSTSTESVSNDSSASTESASNDSSNSKEDVSNDNSASTEGVSNDNSNSEEGSSTSKESLSTDSSASREDNNFVNSNNDDIRSTTQPDFDETIESSTKNIGIINTPGHNPDSNVPLHMLAFAGKSGSRGFRKPQ